MKAMKRLLVLVGVLILLGVAGCATNGYYWTPLPEPGIISAVKIISPDPDVPPQIAAYSGIWEGTWDNERNVTIIIEQIKPPEVIAIYSYGPIFRSKGGWRRVTGRVEGNSIVLQMTARVTLTMTGKNVAHAEWRMEGGRLLYAILSRKSKN